MTGRRPGRARAGVGLEFVSGRGFLDALYRMRPGRPWTDAFALLGEPCEVRFDFADPEFVAADVWNRTSGTCCCGGPTP
jgi:hypothetical protein